MEKRVSVGVGAVAMRGDQVLLVRMNRGGNRGQWSIPGGYVEAGESLEETVAREVREETGLEFHAERLVGLRCGVPDRPDRQETNLYVALVGTVPGDQTPRPDQDEVSEAIFRPAAEAATSEDVAGLTREILTAALEANAGLHPVPRDVSTRNRYRSYQLYL